MPVFGEQEELVDDPEVSVFINLRDESSARHATDISGLEEYLGSAAFLDDAGAESALMIATDAETDAIASADKTKAQRLSEFQQNHISKLVCLQLLLNKLDLSKWYNLLFSFVSTAVSKVRPSSRFLNDSLDINKLVKIKIIEWPDQSLSQFVNGVVHTKTVADRRMQHTITNPQILLLRQALEESSDLQTDLDSEDHMIKLLLKMIEQIKPNVVIFESDVPYRVMCKLRDEYRITVVSNLALHKLKKIARLTRTETVGKIQEMHSQFTLGTCDKFSVVNHSLRLKGKAGVASGGVQKEEMNLMTFEGCNLALGGTIVISGKKEEIAELRLVKTTLRQLLVQARSVALEKYWLKTMPVLIDQIPQLTQELQINSDLSYKSLSSFHRPIDNTTPFFITEPVENRTQFFYHHYTFSHPQQQSQSTYEDPSQKLSEKYIYQNVDKACQMKRKLVEFYKSRDKEQSDITLGRFLIKMYRQAFEVCTECQLPNVTHSQEIYHSDSSIKIIQQFKGKKPINKTHFDKPKEIVNHLIQVRILCNVCNLSSNGEYFHDQNYELSLARFFELLFYNRALYKIKSICICTGVKELYRDFKFIFEVDRQLVITIWHNQESIYQIEKIDPLKVDTKECFRKLVKQQQAVMEDNVQQIIEKSKERYLILKSHLKSALQSTFKTDDNSYNTFLSEVNTVANLADKLDQEFSIFSSECVTQISKIEEDIFAASFINRKLYLNSLTIHRTFMELNRVSALLLTLIKRRKYRLRKIPSSLQQSDHSLLHDFLQKSKKRHCFIEELGFSQDKRKYQSKLKFKSETCPISHKPNSCFNSGEIVAVYQSISEEVHEAQKELLSHYTESPLDQLSASATLASQRARKPSEKSLKESRKNQETFEIMYSTLKLKNVAKVQALDGEAQSDFLTMQTGMNSVFVQVAMHDIGSQIAHTLQSNAYFETLFKSGYMGLETKNYSVTLKGAEDVFNSSSQDTKKLEQELLRASGAAEFRFDTHANMTLIRMKNFQEDEWLSQFQCQTTDHEGKPMNLQDHVVPSVSKDYLENKVCLEVLRELDLVFTRVKNHYFDSETLSILQEHIGRINLELKMNNSGLAPQSFGQLGVKPTPPPTSLNHPSDSISIQAESVADLDQFDNVSKDYIILDQDGKEIQQSLRKQSTKISQSMKQQDKRSLDFSQNNNLYTTQAYMDKQNNELVLPQLKIAKDTVFEIQSPDSLLSQELNGQQLNQQLGTPHIEFKVKVLFPCQFQALRRHFCGTHTDFIASIHKVEGWAASGGKTQANFFRSHDQKYIIKQVDKKEFQMLQEFGPSYFSHMAKVIFHQYPCSLAKILGAYVVQIHRKNEKEPAKKKHFIILENLNLSITPEEEKETFRYDLKGSELNRFVFDQQASVQLDTNFLWRYKSRPFLLNKSQATLLHISLNNDSLVLANEKIIDYSLLTIVNTKKKTVRFGVIDYLQTYTMMRVLESNVKTFINNGTRPTIIPPSQYRDRFRAFMQRHFIGSAVQYQQNNQEECETEQDLIIFIGQQRDELIAIRQSEKLFEESNHSEQLISLPSTNFLKQF